MKSRHLIAGVLSVWALVTVHAEEQDARQIAATVCSTCHGVDGNSTSPSYPKLAGQHKEYFVAQVKAFRDKSRRDPDAHTDMWEIGAQLDDATTVKLAEYYAAQKPARGTPGDAELAAKGKAIYDYGIESKNVPACVFCHGQAGQGMYVFPRLAGQHAEYLVKQIKVFHGDDRPNLARTMQSVVERLSDEEAEQVAEYLQGL